MKKILILLMAVVFATSCDNFLEENPKGSILLDDFFDDEDDVETAMYSVYAPLRSASLFGRYMPVFDVGTDLVGSKSNADYPKPFLYHTINSQSSWIDNVNGTTWLGLWQGVLKSNFILENIEDAPLSESYYAAAVGEARCMRALYYYYLVRMWGDLPIITWFVDTFKFDGTKEMSREPVDRVYKNLIIPDLIYASEHAPAVQIMAGRATKWFAKTLLAEVYMTMAGYRRDSKSGVIAQGDADYWKEALRTIKEVVGEDASGNPDCPFRLLTVSSKGNPYAAIWDDEFTVESLMEVGTYPSTGMGNTLTNEAFSQSSGGEFWGKNPNIDVDIYGNPMDEPMQFQNYHSFARQVSNGLFIPTAEMFHRFEDGDLRKWGMLTEYIDHEGDLTEFTYYCPPTYRKYVDLDVKLGRPGTDANYGDVNFVMYRYADALMIFAESENEVNGVTEAGKRAINAIRNRAGLADLSAENTVSKEAFRRAIRAERAVEFHAEVKRRFDLIRWNEFITATSAYDTYFVPEDNNNEGDDKYKYHADGKDFYLSMEKEVCYTDNKRPIVANEKVYLLPIPAGDIAKTNWYQNKGYN